ncbi:MAG: transglycosylase SLT domain-containing protein [Alphaproteobacteria bacterium]
MAARSWGQTLTACFCAMAAVVAGPGLSQASSVKRVLDPQSPDWSVCRDAAQDLTWMMDLPPHMLAAVSVTETGIAPAGHATKSPWPWTINVEGRGTRYANKAEAVLAARRLRGEGHMSIDVGCMQVNLKYHPRAFTSLEEAFDPLANMTYAAKFLIRLQKRYGDWDEAVRRYHSHRQVHNRRYGKKVEVAMAEERKRLPLVVERPARPVALASVMPIAAIAAAPPVPIPLIQQDLADRLPPAPRRRTPALSLDLSRRLARAAHFERGGPQAINWEHMTRATLSASSLAARSPSALAHNQH